MPLYVGDYTVQAPTTKVQGQPIDIVVTDPNNVLADGGEGLVQADDGGASGADTPWSREGGAAEANPSSVSCNEMTGSGFPYHFSWNEPNFVGVVTFIFTNTVGIPGSVADPPSFSVTVTAPATSTRRPFNIGRGCGSLLSGLCVGGGATL